MDTRPVRYQPAYFSREYLVKNVTQPFNRHRFGTIQTAKRTYEERQFTVLGSQVIQDIYDRMKTELRILKTKKEKGEKVSQLKFKSVCNSIPLRQYKTTHRMDFIRRVVSIQNLRKNIRVEGLEQIPPDAEITNAKSIRKTSGLYLHVTCLIHAKLFVYILDRT